MGRRLKTEIRVCLFCRRPVPSDCPYTGKLAGKLAVNVVGNGAVNMANNLARPVMGGLRHETGGVAGRAVTQNRLRRPLCARSWHEARVQAATGCVCGNAARAHTEERTRSLQRGRGRVTIRPGTGLPAQTAPATVYASAPSALAAGSTSCTLALL